MRRDIALKTLTVIGAALVGFLTLGFLAGTIVHEESHGVACLLLGIPIISWSWEHLVYVNSSNNFVNTLIWLAGGLGQALFSFVLFLCFWYFLKKTEDRFMSESNLSRKTQIVPSIVFGFEIALLGTAFHGIISSLIEGFYCDLYIQIYDNLAIWLPIVTIGTILAAGILYRRQSKYLKI